MAIFKRILSTVLSILLLCALFGCGTRSDSLMAGITPRKTESKADLTGDCAAAVTDFGLKILRGCTAEGNGNVMISPLSVLCALSMTANGAVGETLNQMEAAFGVNNSELREYLSEYVLSLPSNESTALHAANSLWLKDEGLAVEKEFLQLNADCFGAAAYKVPFDNGSLSEINGWVKKNTNGMIPKILDELDPETVAVLVNALAFEGEWADVYESSQVHEREFNDANGTKQTADMMFSEEWQYLEDENAEGFIKPYHGGDYGFAALLPSESMTVNEYLETLSGETLHKILQNARQIDVETGLPKFKCDYSSNISALLQKLGVQNAFDPSLADFTALGTLEGGESIYIDCVVHKTHIDVFEQGTKAGAATAVVMESGAALPIEEPKRVILNRPFVYMIIDMNVRVPVFIGVLNELPE